MADRGSFAGMSFLSAVASSSIRKGSFRMKTHPLRYLVPLCACLGMLWAADVKTDYSHSADFSRYHTYSWMQVKAGNDLWAQRIQRDVDAALAAKGLQKVPSGGDLQVAAFGSTHDQPSIQTFYDSFGGGWFWQDFGDGMSYTTTVNQPEGTLVVDLLDSSSKHLVWRGTANSALSGKPEKNEKKLEHLVDDMFKHFPPK
jgi:hypothetical protein